MAGAALVGSHRGVRRGVDAMVKSACTRWIRGARLGSHSGLWLRLGLALKLGLGLGLRIRVGLRLGISWAQARDRAAQGQVC